VSEAEYLILSDSRDFATDYISVEFERRGRSYLRIDRDLLWEAEVLFEIDTCTLLVSRNGEQVSCSPSSLKAVYYRAPTYLRETFSRDATPEKQLQRSQWMSFFRNLTSFDNALWVNNPNATFSAENKIFQLRVAKEAGFCIPTTIVTNSRSALPSCNHIVIKPIDTVVLAFADQEGFAYTQVVDPKTLDNASIESAPVIAQQYLHDKIDLRVTVVGSRLFPVQILRNGRGIDGDWRLHKNAVTFDPTQLPASVSESCLKLTRRLGLSFAGIDLAVVNDCYYFLEINPTGEWAWLIDSAKLRIDKAICDCLEGLL